jgi:hypothetical protein
MKLPYLPALVPLHASGRVGRVFARHRPAVAAILLTVVPLTGPAGAAAPPAVDPDWPCVVIRVPALSLASAWAGLPVDQYVGTWSADPQLAELVRRVTERRTTVAEAEQAIRAFADAAGPQRRERLLALMAGAFSTLADERRSVMAGLDRMGRRQKELTTDVRADLDALRTAQATDGAETGPLASLQQKVGWEIRLFEQRRQLLHGACDVPTRIEQRLFALARILQPMVQ